MLKKYSSFIALLYTLALATVCLIQIKELPDVKVSFGDKIFHFLTYSVLTLLWYYAFFAKFKIGRVKAIIYASVFSILFGIIIEVLQGSVTTSRFADIYDVLANTLGVLFTALLLLINKRVRIKNL